ncbi:AMP-binding protein [Streptomyces sp. KL116D]|uniref:AMP-binding protein n=1 Tax=Streptomyces sp. KL116D TaxID=3045152 RepID=UPI003558B7B7
MRNAEAHPTGQRSKFSDGADLDRLTKRTQAERATRAAHRMLERVAPGEKVAVWGANSVPWVVVLNTPAHWQAWCSYFAEHLTRRRGVRPDQTAGAGARLLLALGWTIAGGRCWRVAQKLASSLPAALRPTFSAFGSLEQGRRGTARACPRSPQMILLVQYTSGTTAVLRAAVLTPACVNTARFGLDRQRTGAEYEVIMCSLLPLHHVGASVCGVLVMNARARWSPRPALMPTLC